MAQYETTGILLYSRSYLVAEVDQDIADYYYSLIPKYMRAQKQMWHAHVTVARIDMETIEDMSKWGLHEKEEVSLGYDSIIRQGSLYFWLDAWSERLEEIRSGLGLSPIPQWYNKFHITIGNLKGVSGLSDPSS